MALLSFYTLLRYGHCNHRAVADNEKRARREREIDSSLRGTAISLVVGFPWQRSR